MALNLYSLFWKLGLYLHYFCNNCLFHLPMYLISAVCPSNGFTLDLSIHQTMSHCHSEIHQILRSCYPRLSWDVKLLQQWFALLHPPQDPKQTHHQVLLQKSLQLCWPETSWSLFFGLFFCSLATFYLSNNVFIYVYIYFCLFAFKLTSVHLWNLRILRELS